MKKIVCILNAITDAPLNDIGGLTPLQRASHPNLDNLTKKGDFVAIWPPQFPGRATALATLLGGKALQQRLSHGPLKAYARGYRLTPGQKAYSMRFISTAEGVVIDVGDTIITDDEGKALCKHLNNNLKEIGCYFIHTVGPHAVMVTEVPYDLPTISGERPISAVGTPWLGNTESADAVAFMKQIFDLLTPHEINSLRIDLEENFINAVLLSEGGTLPYDEFGDEISSSLFVTSSETSKGVARLLNIPVIMLPKEEKKYDALRFVLSNLDTMVEKSETLFIEFFYLWGSTYKGDLLEKIKTIEYLDKYLIDPLMRYGDEKGADIVVMPLTHSSITTGEWIHDAVPAVLYPAKSERQAPAFEEIYLRGASCITTLDRLLQERCGE